MQDIESDSPQSDYAERLADLPRADVADAFPPAEPVDRDDPWNAFVHTFRADAPAEGPLQTFDVAVKENVAVAGVPLTAGSGVLDADPGTDAVVVERLRAAGAALVGTTAMDPLGFGTTGEDPPTGPVTNPTVPDRVAGGSSAGSAAAVAGGDVDAALGTDTGGSVRIPAAYCGVVGVKPTYGLVPRIGVLPMSPANDHVGVLADDVASAAAMLDAIAGRTAVDASTWPGPSRTAFADDLAAGHVDAIPGCGDGTLTVGVPEEFVAAAVADVGATVERALGDLLAVDGVHVEDVAFPEHESAAYVNDALTVAEFSSLLSGDLGIHERPPATVRAMFEQLNERREELPERVRRLARAGADLADDQAAMDRLWDARRRIVRRVEALFGAVDVLATPTTPTVAPEPGVVGGGDTDGTTGSATGGGLSVRETCRNTAPFNLAGAPAASVPCGAARGCPVGVQIVAPPGEDARCLQVARLVERVVD